MLKLNSGERSVPVCNLRLLCEFNQGLAHVQDVNAILHNVVAFVDKIIQVRHGFLGIVNRPKNELVVEAVFGPGFQNVKGNRCSLQDAKTSELMLHGGPIIVPNLAEEPLLQGLDEDMRSSGIPFACAPLQWGDTSLGILGVSYPRPAIEEEAIRLLGLVASCISPVLVVIRWGDETSLDDILRSKLERAVERMDVQTESHGSLMADVVALVEQILIKAALKKVNYVQVGAARFLGINRNTLRKKIRELDIYLP